MHSSFWIDVRCAAGSCLLASGFLLNQLRGKKPPPGFLMVLGTTLLLGVLFAAIALAAESSPSVVIQTWTKLYGRETPKAALLTTTRFREGQSYEVWAAKAHRALHRIGYQHLGGTIIREEIRGKTAMVTLRAKIRTLAGVVEQVELYVLSREHVGWLLDQLQIVEEHTPEDSSPRVYVPLRKFLSFADAVRNRSICRGCML